MWFEIPPWISVMAMCLLIPGIATAHIHTFANRGKGKKAFQIFVSVKFDGKRHISGVNCYYVSKRLETINQGMDEVAHEKENNSGSWE
uniref:NADH dehydrogenase [ubiquinone] 1 alpha subcomplex subunit 1-like n=1 Tax=Panthera onca TaxID=9690 RepID=UPI0029555154|nr:NADH dehydrogenase [ubiquinone] 1 alpha subcomplex subunit 1-like [Panthera onca]